MKSIAIEMGHFDIYKFLTTVKNADELWEAKCISANFLSFFFHRNYQHLLVYIPIRFRKKISKLRDVFIRIFVYNCKKIEDDGLSQTDKRKFDG